MISLLSRSKYWLLFEGKETNQIFREIAQLSSNIFWKQKKTFMVPELNLLLFSSIVWNKKKYIGTSLKQDDKRLGEYVRFLKKNNVAIVKLDSAQRTKNVSSEEDVYPSLIAISWLGPDYQVALKDRRATCEHFFKFLTMLRKNNWHIPVLIGGDFNMDMKSFDFQKYYSDFCCVPYRPVSGSLARDLKNTFLFTLDSIQVTETNIKQVQLFQKKFREIENVFFSRN